MISYTEAMELTLENIQSLEPEELDLIAATGRVVAQNLRALVDSPSLNVSLKDGYAVRSNDIAAATPDQPVRLRLIGHAAAGQTGAA